MKKKYLLDTNICVFCMRGMIEMNRKILLAGIDNCYLSEITVAELYYGANSIATPSCSSALNGNIPANSIVKSQHFLVY